MNNLWQIRTDKFSRDKEAAIEKLVLLLVHNNEAIGREPKFSKAQPFAKITLPPDAATMDDCCSLADVLKFAPELLLPTDVPPLAPNALRAEAMSLARAYLIGMISGLTISGVTTSIFLTISSIRATFSA